MYHYNDRLHRAMCYNNVTRDEERRLLPKNKNYEKPRKENNMKLNLMKETIELTKAEARKINNPNNNELYDALMKHRADFPTFKIVVVEPKKTSTTFKGMNCAFMENYVLNHDETGEKMAQYKKLRNDRSPYGAIKKWFMEQYPQFKEFTTRTQWVLAA